MIKIETIEIGIKVTVADVWTFLFEWLEGYKGYEITQANTPANKPIREWRSMRTQAQCAMVRAGYPILIRTKKA